MSTQKELEWIKTKLAGTQFEEASTCRWLAENDGEREWLKKSPAETQAELDSSRNEVEVLKRLNSAGAGAFPRLVLPRHHLVLRADQAAVPS